MTESKVIVAIDKPEIVSTILNVDPKLCNVKIGKHMFTKYGPAIVRKFQDKNFNVFLDLKFHDIPNTVADAVEAAADLGVWMVNMHAIGGRRMMETAKERLDKCSHLKKPMLIAVTVLTSMTEEDLTEMAIMHTPESLVWSLARNAYKAGMDGVVCSPKEITSIKYSAEMDNNFKMVVPGVRPLGSALNDQARVATPEEAVGNGATYIVIGRPILNAPDPVEALLALNNSLINPSMEGASIASEVYG